MLYPGAARYRVVFLLFVLALFSFSCKELTSVIDAPSFTIPVLHFPSTGVVDRDTIDTKLVPGGTGASTDNVVVNFTVRIFASDSTGISGVSGSILSPNWPETGETSTTLSNFQLHDDGKDGDAVAGDSVFTGNVSFEIYRYQIGKYNLRFQAVNNLNTSSTILFYPVTLINTGNHPPKFEFVQTTKDTLVLADSIDAAVLTAKLSDVEGMRDILSVKTQATKPDGTLSNTVVTLFDDGLKEQHADEIKGDSVYSTGIKLDPASNPEKGAYTFRFIAQDKSNARDTASLVIFVK